MLYLVSATAVKKSGSGHMVIQVPSFMLHKDTLGITGIEHARKVAKAMLLDLLPIGSAVSVDVVRVDEVIEIGRVM